MFHFCRSACGGILCFPTVPDTSNKERETLKQGLVLNSPSASAGYSPPGAEQPPAFKDAAASPRGSDTL